MKRVGTRPRALAGVATSIVKKVTHDDTVRDQGFFLWRDGLGETDIEKAPRKTAGESVTKGETCDRRAEARKIEELERISRRPTSRPNNELLGAHRGSLEAAACSVVAERHPHVGILTDFPVITPDGACVETDGPAAAVLLGLSLRAAKIPTRIAVSSRCRPILRAALALFSDSERPEVDELCGPSEIVSTIERWRSATPRVSHALAIETAGPASGGAPRDMRGRDLTAWAIPWWELFSAGPWATIGIGDGGNELGMGSLPREAMSGVPHGTAIICTVGCDFLLPSAISHWGALALGFAISLLVGKRGPAMRFYLTVENQRQILAALVEAGAVDGVSLRSETSIDGVSAEELARSLVDFGEACR